MSKTSGVFAVSRDIFEHEFFAREALTEREAWIWLIREAAWKARRTRVHKTLVTLERGQLAHSTRFMAAAWEWSEARVRRFLKRLKSDAMIDVVSDARSTLVTICNYDKFQRVSLPKDADDDASTDAVATQERRSSDANKKTGNTLKAGNKDTAGFQPAAQSIDLQNLHGSAEEKFWAMAPALQGTGISKGLMGKLANILGGDFDNGVRILRDSGNAKKPAAYLGKIIKDLIAEAMAELPPATDPTMPAWIIEARAYGYPVEREGCYWRFAGGLYNDGKELVGN